MRPALIDRLDHLVLTTAHEAEGIASYTQVLDLQSETFIGGTAPVTRQALHLKGHEFEPKARTHRAQSLPARSTARS